MITTERKAREGNGNLLPFQIVDSKGLPYSRAPTGCIDYANLSPAPSSPTSQGPAAPPPRAAYWDTGAGQMLIRTVRPPERASGST